MRSFHATRKAAEEAESECVSLGFTEKEVKVSCLSLDFCQRISVELKYVFLFLVLHLSEMWDMMYLCRICLTSNVETVSITYINASPVGGWAHLINALMLR